MHVFAALLCALSAFSTYSLRIHAQPGLAQRPLDGLVDAFVDTTGLKARYLIEGGWYAIKTHPSFQYASELAMVASMVIGMERDGKMVKRTLTTLSIDPIKHGMLSHLLSMYGETKKSNKINVDKTKEILLKICLSDNTGWSAVDSAKLTYFMKPECKIDACRSIMRLPGAFPSFALEMKSENCPDLKINTAGIFRQVSSSKLLVYTTTMEFLINDVLRGNIDDGIAILDPITVFPLSEKYVFTEFVSSSVASTEDLRNHVSNLRSQRSIAGLLLISQLFQFNNDHAANVVFSQEIGLFFTTFEDQETSLDDSHVPVTIGDAFSPSEFRKHFHMSLENSFQALFEDRDRLFTLAEKLSNLLPPDAVASHLDRFHHVLCKGEAGYKSCFNALWSRLTGGDPIHSDPSDPIAKHVLALMGEEAASSDGPDAASFKIMVETSMRVSDLVLYRSFISTKAGSDITEQGVFYMNRMSPYFTGYQTGTWKDLPLSRFASIVRGGESVLPQDGLTLPHPFPSPPQLGRLYQATFDRTNNRITTVTLTNEEEKDQFIARLMFLPHDSRVVYPALCSLLNQIWVTMKDDGDVLLCPQSAPLPRNTVAMQVYSDEEALGSSLITDRALSFGAILVTSYLFRFTTLETPRMLFSPSKNRVYHREGFMIPLKSEWKFPAFFYDVFDGDKTRIMNFVEADTVKQLFRLVSQQAPVLEKAMERLFAYELRAGAVQQAGTSSTLVNNAAQHVRSLFKYDSSIQQYPGNDDESYVLFLDSCRAALRKLQPK